MGGGRVGEAGSSRPSTMLRGGVAMSDDYVWGADDTDIETQRLDAVEALFEENTQRRLTSIGLYRGERYLEVAAGRGTTALFLLSRCGASGRVVATDIDTRWLDEIRHPNLTVVRHDIVVDDVAPLGMFDVIHVRFLLHHLGLQRAALTIERLHGLLRPGGRLLVEETIGDNRADPGHPSSAANVADVDAFIDHVGQFGFDIDIGLQLPRLFTTVGFVDVDNEITNKVRHGGDTFSRFVEVSMRSTMDTIPFDELYTDGVHGALERLADESLHYLGFQQLAIWGTRSA